MNIKQLAEAVGVTPGTVSKAFAESREVSPETKERIFQLAKADGSFEKYYKGKREMPLIAVLCPEAESEFYGVQIGALERGLRSRGCNTVMALTRFDRDLEATLFSELVYRLRVDGVILLGSGERVCNPDEIPLIILGGEGKSAGADRIQNNFGEVMLQAVHLLKAHGHRRVAFIGETLTHTTLRFFRTAMRQAGLGVYEKYIVTESRRFGEGGYSAMSTLLDRGDVPTAVVAAYDYMALGAMRCARDRGLRIPEDISFIGTDDITVAPYLDVPLTSIRTHTEEVCERIVDLLLQKMENRHYRSREILQIRNELLVRSSVADAPGKQENVSKSVDKSEEKVYNEHITKP